MDEKGFPIYPLQQTGVQVPKPPLLKGLTQTASGTFLFATHGFQKRQGSLMRLLKVQQLITKQCHAHASRDRLRVSTNTVLVFVKARVEILLVCVCVCLGLTTASDPATGLRLQIQSSVRLPRVPLADYRAVKLGAKFYSFCFRPERYARECMINQTSGNIATVLVTRVPKVP